MSMTSRKPILVTGSHRSGTTWVAKTLSESSYLRYIPEQFNLNRNKEIKFKYWFQYINEDIDSNNNHYFSDNIGKLLLSSQEKYIYKSFHINNIVTFIEKISKYIYYKTFNIQPIIKDPIALFSAEWLASKFNMNVLVLIRHPAAFVGSLKRMNWTFDFTNFLEQTLLIEKYLYSFKDEIREYISRESNLIEQAILLWRIFHYVILHYKQLHPEWLFVRHEDISREPKKVFAEICDQFHIKDIPKIQRAIEIYNNSDGEIKMQNNKIHVLQRNSQANIWSWKNRLTVEEITKIRKKTEDLYPAFYSDKDW